MSNEYLSMRAKFAHQFESIKQAVAAVEAKARSGKPVDSEDVVFVCEVFRDITRIYEKAQEAIDSASKVFDELVKGPKQ